jgi:CheY-like chemotaxis protein
MTDQLALIIEDDFDASQIFSKALEVQGFKTEAIHDGEKALERLRTAAPYIIVLDLHLPNVDGTEILAWVRSMPALKETLVIVVTADARMGETLDDKADLVLLKPATFTQIRDFTARLISRKRKVAAEAEAKAAEAEPTPEAKPIAESTPVETAPTVETLPTADLTPTPEIILVAEAVSITPPAPVATIEEAAKESVTVSPSVSD